MDTIKNLEQNLALAKKQQEQMEQEDSPRVPTGIVVDLRGPEGNVFYILGLCKKLAHEYLEKWEEDIFTQETRLDGTQDYKQILATCRKWFGLIYLTADDD